MNFEHSHSDGTTWNRMVHEIWHDMHSNGETSAYGPMPALGNFNGASSQPLSFVLDENEEPVFFRKVNFLFHFRI